MRPHANTLTPFFLCSLAALLILSPATAEFFARSRRLRCAREAKIGAITAFINLDRAQYKEQVADALKMLSARRRFFESRGYQGATIRIATQPFPEYTAGLTTEQPSRFSSSTTRWRLRKVCGIDCPAMMNAGDSDTQANCWRKS